MNKKGFTLVELLAVIIILSLLALLASTSVSKIVKDSKNDLYDTQINLIKSAAEAWGADNLYDLPDDGTCKYLTLRDLKQYGLIDSEIKNPRTNELFPDNLIIKITGKKNSFGVNNITYEVDSADVENCERIYSICTLVNDADNSESITPGDKYQCKVKDDMETGFENGYYFFVLSHNEDGTTNLIMERNIYYDKENDVGKVATEENIGLVNWYSGHAPYGDGSFVHNSNGPTGAMDYLNNATKDWNNVPNMIMDYKDEGGLQSDLYGYGEIKTTVNITTITRKNGEETLKIENLKARMPYLGEVIGENKCFNTSNNWSCPLWLTNYLNSSSYVTGENLHNIKNIYGYWTLSSYPLSEFGACGVSHEGAIYAQPVYHTGDFQMLLNNGIYGVRPVITLEI